MDLQEFLRLFRLQPAVQALVPAHYHMGLPCPLDDATLWIGFFRREPTSQYALACQLTMVYPTYEILSYRKSHSGETLVLQPEADGFAPLYLAQLAQYLQNPTATTKESLGGFVAQEAPTFYETIYSEGRTL